jgi:hypothetical protein
MAKETIFDQITHETVSASRKKPKKTMLHVCCMCGLLQDEAGASLDQDRWVTQRTFRKMHGVHPDNCLLTHTYCPACFTQVVDRIGEWNDG